MASRLTIAIDSALQEGHQRQEQRQQQGQQQGQELEQQEQLSMNDGDLDEMMYSEFLFPYAEVNTSLI
jgi:hypothetical protein